MESTLGVPQWRVVEYVLETSFGKRISLLDIKHPFKNDTRKEIASHTQYVTKFRKTHPHLKVTNVKREIGNVIYSWYMVHVDGDELDKQVNEEMENLITRHKLEQEQVKRQSKDDLMRLQNDIYQ